ncbi:uncharacterized protein TNCV_1014821 [Trichonephila clavipes]|uniref:Transposase n=1 Tax=Trichonephila clavipes TaxID=2585209 RepID=A0A8X6VXU4_TRICX|nr:uncharacterized protein TNCV_1014821 [Trichonephila clavipes]
MQISQAYLITLDEENIWFKFFLDKSLSQDLKVSLSGPEFGSSPLGYLNTKLEGPKGNFIYPRKREIVPSWDFHVSNPQTGTYTLKTRRRLGAKSPVMVSVYGTPPIKEDPVTARVWVEILESKRFRTLNCNKTTMYYSIDMNFFYSKDNLVALHFKYDQARRRFVEWAQNEIAVVPDFHKRILFSDEAHFWLNGYVNKQNCRIWRAGFQQDGATCHTARATIDLLKDTLGDRLISRFGPVNWPPRSWDLTPLDYFLWGYVKSLVYADKPQTLDHLEDNIRRVIADIRPQMLEKVIENWTSRLDSIRASRGSHMPEIIFKM